MSNTALLVMDVQRVIVERFAGSSPGLLPALQRAVAGARQHGVQVIHVGVQFRPGAPEVSMRNKAFAGLVSSGFMAAGSPDTEFHPDVAPAGGDIVVYKKRVSAFAGSDLDMVLRARSITSLVLCGISTSGVVLSTVRQAADMDFELTVLRDGCADGDDEVHRVLLDKVFPRQASVVSVDDWVAALSPLRSSLGSRLS
jgi:nicotinamidase-related amidase